MKLFGLIFIIIGAASLYFGKKMKFVKAQSLSEIFGDIQNQSPDQSFTNIFKVLARIWIKIFGVVGGVCFLIFGLFLLLL